MKNLIISALLISNGLVALAQNKPAAKPTAKPVAKVEKN